MQRYGDWSQTGTLDRLSIPFIGIFLLQPPGGCGSYPGLEQTFNSLYWDFLIATQPCFFTSLEHSPYLSIPFIGIFLLQRSAKLYYNICRHWPFNSLYWDFLIATRMNSFHENRPFLSIPFIGIFLLQPGRQGERGGRRELHFQFPLLGFSYCNSAKYWRLHTSFASFNSLYWDFLIATDAFLGSFVLVGPLSRVFWSPSSIIYGLRDPL